MPWVAQWKVAVSAAVCGIGWRENRSGLPFAIARSANASRGARLE